MNVVFDVVLNVGKTQEIDAGVNIVCAKGLYITRLKEWVTDERIIEVTQYVEKIKEVDLNIFKEVIKTSYINSVYEEELYILLGKEVINQVSVINKKIIER